MSVLKSFAFSFLECSQRISYYNKRIHFFPDFYGILKRVDTMPFSEL